MPINPRELNANIKHLLSTDVGELDVYVIDESEFIDDDDVQPVFIKSGNQGPDWQRGEIYIDQQDEPYQVK